MKVNEIIKSIILILVLLMVIPVFIKNISDQYAHLMKEKTKVGVVSFKETLKDAEPYINNLKTLFKDNSIKAIMLKMDCGGGAAGTSQVIFNEIKALKQIHPKPVITFVENVCASGAYYIACASDTIIASPSAFIGSVGVYIPLPQLKDFIEQFKIKYNVVKAGTYKTAGDMFLENSPEQRAMLQELTNATYNQFVADVAANRLKLSKNSNEWAQGKVFTGTQALAFGLIDKVGSPSTVEQELHERIAITGDIEWITTKKPFSWSQIFAEADADSFSDVVVEKITQTLEKQQGIQARV